MAELNYVTQDTFDKMQEDLQRMRTVDRPAASKAIAEAREKGDLKENAEYDAAKEAQGMLEAKIKYLEGALANSRILNTSDIDTSKVSILTKVKITNLKTKKTVEYKLVGESEADLKAGKISVSSPIGKGLIGKAVGDVADITVPSGLMQFKIEAISI
ncbi:transcription elongation factor GreA [Polluticaenibacter yanchengensis]|uniref:Transcription elongation factor GreA n=1 Tax=Polluticaenibacter yanchengensis TaxID=3014562 RepID=A0ABT4UJY9_9BACT|nr:transcription elongation factor GreA [Chitinophagaceae bacterium LY-5]